MIFTATTKSFSQQLQNHNDVMSTIICSETPCTVHDTLKWTVPRECHSRQISREMPHAGHLACHSIINRGSSIPMPLEPRTIDRAHNVSQISRGRSLTVKCLSPCLSRGFRGTHAFFVQFHMSCSVPSMPSPFRGHVHPISPMTPHFAFEPSAP